MLHLEWRKDTQSTEWIQKQKDFDSNQQEPMTSCCFYHEIRVRNNSDSPKAKKNLTCVSTTAAKVAISIVFCVPIHSFVRCSAAPRSTLWSRVTQRHVILQTKNGTRQWMIRGRFLARQQSLECLVLSIGAIVANENVSLFISMDCEQRKSNLRVHLGELRGREQANPSLPQMELFEWSMLLNLLKKEFQK